MYCIFWLSKHKLQKLKGKEIFLTGWTDFLFEKVDFAPLFLTKLL